MADMARAVRSIATLPDPIGTSTWAGRCRTAWSWCAAACRWAWWRWSYEGRPNVTVDAVSLCIKSGNAVILRGSRLASRSNLILAEVLTGR